MPESGASLRKRADAAVSAGQFKQASELYRREAEVYRSHGDVQGAKVEDTKADQYASDVRLFAQLPFSAPPAFALPVGNVPLAKWEPAYGCYLGGFFDRDERLGKTFYDENEQTHYDPDALKRLTGKKHATAFCYVAYGKGFPARWTARLRGQNVAAHVAWEPNDGLDPVKDDEYLNNWARDAARARCPIFLRFASEMNGDWTRYGGSPARYIEKWRLVKSVFDRHAPNVALVWCVNTIPEPPIPQFYPGDDAVDWVGINFYAVPFHDNLRERPALMENAADNLKYVYHLYAAKKPIMVCEFGASHRAALDNVERAEWAGRKISELYAALPRLYPRVKCIDIFDNDNLKYALPGRQLNNYSVTDLPAVAAAYTKAIAPDYYLSDVTGKWGALDGTPATPAVIAPLVSGATVPVGTLRVSAEARSYSQTLTVAYKVNGKVVVQVPETGAREADLPLTTPGAAVISATVLDDRGKVAAEQTVRVVVK